MSLLRELWLLPWRAGSPWPRNYQTNPFPAPNTGVVQPFQGVSNVKLRKRPCAERRARSLLALPRRSLLGRTVFPATLS